MIGWVPVQLALLVLNFSWDFTNRGSRCTYVSHVHIAIFISLSFVYPDICDNLEPCIRTYVQNIVKKVSLFYLD